MLLSTVLLTSPLLLGGSDGTCAAKAATAHAETKKTLAATVLSEERFSTLAAAVKAAGLGETLASDAHFTIFAPNNAAFAKLPKEQLTALLQPENRGLLTSILTYHVVPGELPAERVVASKFTATANGQRLSISVSDKGVLVGSARVVATDITCSNGVIHEIDSVLIPSTMDLIDTAIDAGSFKTLTAAIEAAGLVEALSGKKEFTVLAPTDEAFAKLPEGTVASLLEPENRGKLASILKLHVVPGRVYASDVLASSEVSTLHGQHLKVRVTDGEAFVGSARILKTDIDTTNGVIHVIDKVLLPE